MADKLYVGATGNEGSILIRDSQGRETIHIDGESAALYVGTDGNEGDIIVRDCYDHKVFRVDGETAAVYIGAANNEGDLFILDGWGRQVFHFDSDSATLDVGTGANGGDIKVYSGITGKKRIHLNGSEGDIIVCSPEGGERIRLDGNTGDIKLLGADCAEEFDVAGEAIDPGTVLVINDKGMLRACTQAYDRCVAGVVSGANGLTPGIILDKNPASNPRAPIALNGKVYCKVDAQSGPIHVGDLLTTSDVPGHAMKADDPSRAFGAVIGKALCGLETGRGLIPILVSLQ